MNRTLGSIVVAMTVVGVTVNFSLATGIFEFAIDGWSKCVLREHRTLKTNDAISSEEAVSLSFGLCVRAEESVRNALKLENPQLYEIGGEALIEKAKDQLTEALKTL